jgi:hypothetical protein
VPPVLSGDVVERGQVPPVTVELGERVGVLRVELFTQPLKRQRGTSGSYPCQ